MYKYLVGIKVWKTTIVQWSESELATALQKLRVHVREASRCTSCLWSIVNGKEVQSRSWKAENRLLSENSGDAKIGRL